MDIPYTVTARPDTGLYNGKLGIWLFLASEVMLFGALFTAYLFMRLGADAGTWPTHVQSIPLGFTNTCVLIISSITMVYAWVALKERNFAKYRMFLGATICCGILFLFIKGTEYYDKYMHWGFMIKPDAIAKYQPELQKMDAFMNWIPSENSGDGAWEVRGHLHERTADTFTIAPDKTFPSLLARRRRQGARRGSGRQGGDGHDRQGRLHPRRATCCPPTAPTTRCTSPSPACTPCTSSAASCVMLYFLGPGSRLYRRNPEQLTNRIEVTGIFWHFVDLVWITVFPIIYLT